MRMKTWTQSSPWFSRKMSSPSRRSYDDFNSKEFLNSFYGSIEGNPLLSGRFAFQWEQMHNFYTKYSCKWNNIIKLPDYWSLGEGQ